MVVRIILWEATAKQLIEMLKVHFTTFGISQELASDEGSQFTAGETKAWGCSQRLSSAYYPHINCQAELGVKSAKRLLRENINQDGSLSGDRFFRALMQHRLQGHFCRGSVWPSNQGLYAN